MTSLLCSSLMQSLPRSLIAFACTANVELQMLKSCITNMTERHPGLVLHMLDILDDNSKHALKHSTDYVAQAQAWYLGSTFVPRLQYLRSLLR